MDASSCSTGSEVSYVSPERLQHLTYIEANLQSIVNAAVLAYQKKEQKKWSSKKDSKKENDPRARSETPKVDSTKTTKK